MGCKYCYAWGKDNPKAMCKRFKWDPELRFDPEILKEIEHRKKPAGIFMCSTMELFHPQIPDIYKIKILSCINKCSHHRFYILSKCPNELLNFSFMSHIWLGTTVTGAENYSRLFQLTTNSTNLIFVSFEPLLTPVDCVRGFEDVLQWYSWVIIGAQTGGKKSTRVIPKKEWVEPIIEQADKNGIPVFIKNNMKELMDQWGMPFRQEMPEESFPPGRVRPWRKNLKLRV